MWKDTWHIESKQILQPPNYLIITVNRITYSNNRITKNKMRMPLDLYIKLGPYKLNFPYKLLWTIMDTLWTVVITQSQSIVVGKHFPVTIIKQLNVISRIPIIYLLPIYSCTSSWNVRAAICLEGRLSLLALSSVYSLTVEDGIWSTPMVPAQLSVPVQQVAEHSVESPSMVDPQWDIWYWGSKWNLHRSLLKCGWLRVGHNLCLLWDYLCLLCP